MERHILPSQIFVFETLHEFAQYVDSVIQMHKSELSAYEEELGMMLRQEGHDGNEAEWAKEMQGKLATNEKKAPKGDGKKDENKDKEKEKKEMKRKEEKKRKDSTKWRMYKDIRIFTGAANQGKTEVYFEAVNELKIAFEKLRGMKETLTQLTSIGLGNVIYLVYTKNGIPEKLVLLPEANKDEGKFEFKADFVTDNAELPLESG